MNYFTSRKSILIEAINFESFYCLSCAVGKEVVEAAWGLPIYVAMNMILS